MPQDDDYTPGAAVDAAIELFDQLEERIDRIEERLDRIEAKLNRIQRHFEEAGRT